MRAQIAWWCVVLLACADGTQEPEPTPRTEAVTQSQQLKQRAGRCSTAWSLVRRALLAAPEGVSASQVDRITELIKRLGDVRRGQSDRLRADEQRKLLQSVRASAAGSRPSVTAALKQVEKHLPPQ